MLKSYFTGGSAKNMYANKARRCLIQINTGFTGTLTLSDETGTTGSPVFAVITNPVVGQQFEYWDIQNGVCITPSGSGADVTASFDLARSGV